MLLSEIARTLGVELSRDAPDVNITRIGPPELADRESITFLSDPRYEQAVRDCAAVAVLTRKGTGIESKVCLEVEDPYVAYARVASFFEPRPHGTLRGTHPAAFVDPEARVDETAVLAPHCVVMAGCAIGPETYIGPACVIERNCRVGKQCRIHSGAVICRDSSLGDRVIIEPGAVIGSSGFGNAREKGEFTRIPSLGNVVIEDDVWIGANTTIDRASFESTVISRGARLDNLVHIAHNVAVGEHSAMAAQAGVSGSTRIGKRVLVGGQAGFVGHITIGDDAFVGAKAGVSKNVASKAKVTGCPARDLMGMRRIEAAQAQLPRMAKELKRLRKELESIRQSISGS